MKFEISDPSGHYFETKPTACQWMHVSAIANAAVDQDSILGSRSHPVALQ
jgi:hypothetical protein